MRPLVALSAFLDVSSLNLAVPEGAAIFCPAHRLQEHRPRAKGPDEDFPVAELGQNRTE
jgi:hypothetical protein